MFGWTDPNYLDIRTLEFFHDVGASSLLTWVQADTAAYDLRVLARTLARLRDAPRERSLFHPKQTLRVVTFNGPIRFPHTHFQCQRSRTANARAKWPQRLFTLPGTSLLFDLLLGPILKFHSVEDALMRNFDLIFSERRTFVFSGYFAWRLRSFCESHLPN